MTRTLRTTLEPYVSARLRERYGDLDGFDQHVGITSIRVVHQYLMGGWGMEDTARPEALLEDLHTDDDGRN